VTVSPLLVVVEPWGVGRPALPRRFEARAHLWVVDRLVAGENVRHGAVVARSLHVVVSAQRIRARVWPHIVAGEQQEIGDGRRRIGALRVLRDAYRPEDADAVCR